MLGGFFRSGDGKFRGRVHVSNQENTATSLIKVMFVDDDPALLENLQEAMADMAGRWQMSFLSSGREGLAAFAADPADVVVSDLWMPGMNGAEFLREVQVRHPGSIRFVVSSNSDRALASELIERAHQFIAKPCDPAYLKAAITRAWNLGHKVHNEAIKELVARLGQLPSVPALYLEINALLDSNRATVDNLGTVIARDPGMTTMVLKLVNSAFFGLRHPVAAVSDALPYLGVDLLKSLVLAHGLFQSQASFDIGGFTLSHLWQHSLQVAFKARRIAEAEQAEGHVPSECFTAGILHDVGILVLASRFPDGYGRVLDMCVLEGCDLESAEYHVFGVSHAEVGGYLLGLWGLPSSIVQAVAWHNFPRNQEHAGFGPLLAVHAANAFCASGPVHPIFSRASLDRACLKSLGLAGRLGSWKDL